MSPVLTPAKQLSDVASLLSHHNDLRRNIDRHLLIADALDRRECIAMQSGALATWLPAAETGRIPKDTYIVRHEETADQVDWNSPTAIPLSSDIFDRLFADAVQVLKKKETVYVTDRVIGASSAYALPTTVVTDKALTALFTDNMFRPVPEDIEQSVFAGEEFTLIALPYDKIDVSTYVGQLREAGGKTVNMIVAMDFDRKLGLVYGASYLGCVKKLMFTVMNHLLPEKGIMPLHCSAVENPDGSSALFLGLSGTGKTTLSNHPGTRLIGDDEHGWDSEGVANFENGCYAKLINLRKDKEPDIYNAVFTEKPVTEHGTIVENAMVYPDGSCDLFDARFSENSRTSYPLTALPSAKPEAVTGHPSKVLFLTADAHGVLPPIAKLTPAQAMIWFLMGYTSKLAGTEVGITEPVSAFSRFFGGPFMPRQPRAYTDLMQKQLEAHGSEVYLVNTGWTGGAYGTGERIDILVSRAIVDAILKDNLTDVVYTEDPRFHLSIPHSCPGVESSLLDPKTTWADPAAYETAADTLASEFSAFFDKTFGGAGLPEAIVRECPGK